RSMRASPSARAARGPRRSRCRSAPPAGCSSRMRRRGARATTDQASSAVAFGRRRIDVPPRLFEPFQTVLVLEALTLLSQSPCRPRHRAQRHTLGRLRGAVVEPARAAPVVPFIAENALDNELKLVEPIDRIPGFLMRKPI